jgi:hypothetical protein
VHETYERDLPFLGCAKRSGENVWSVHFRWETPDLILFDGGGVDLIVDDETGKVQYSEDWFNEEYQKGNFEVTPLEPKPGIVERMQRRLKKR